MRPLRIYALTLAALFVPFMGCDSGPPEPVVVTYTASASGDLEAYQVYYTDSNDETVRLIAPSLPFSQRVTFVDPDAIGFVHLSMNVFSPTTASATVTITAQRGDQTLTDTDSDSDTSTGPTLPAQVSADASLRIGSY